MPRDNFPRVNHNCQINSLKHFLTMVIKLETLTWLFVIKISTSFSGSGTKTHYMKIQKLPSQ